MLFLLWSILAACTRMLFYNGHRSNRTSVGVDLTVTATSLNTSLRIFSGVPSTIFFEIPSPQTKAAYISLGLKMLTYIVASVKDLRPQLLSMACSSCDMEAVSSLYLISMWDFQESLPSSLTRRYLYLQLSCRFPILGSR